MPNHPRNSTNLTPIENARNLMKNKVQEKQPYSIIEFKILLRDLWVHMDIDYFINLSDSVPNRLSKVKLFYNYLIPDTKLHRHSGYSCDTEGQEETQYRSI